MVSLSSLHYIVVFHNCNYDKNVFIQLRTIITSAALSNNPGWIICRNLKSQGRFGELIENEERTFVKSRRAVGDRSLSYRFGVISIQTIRTSCIRGLLGTVYRYLGQSHVLGEAEKVLSPKRTIPPVRSDLITSKPSLVEMSETLFMDSLRRRREQFFSRRWR